MRHVSSPAKGLPQGPSQTPEPAATAECSSTKDPHVQKLTLLTTLTRPPQPCLGAQLASFSFSDLAIPPTRVLLLQPLHRACGGALTSLPPFHDTPQPSGRQNLTWPLLTFLVPSHATCLYLPHIPAIPNYYSSLDIPCCFLFCILVQALPLPTGLQEAQMSPLGKALAEASVS